MPLYEYQCDTCGAVFEKMQKFSDAPLTVHEGCGGAVHRLLSPPALQFKGSGFYITDYARGGNAKGGKDAAAKPAKEGAGKSESTSTESKPAAAPAAAKSTSSSESK